MDGTPARAPVTPFAGVASVAMVNRRVREILEAGRFEHLQGNPWQVVTRQHVTGQDASVGVNAQVIPPRAADVLMRRAEVTAVYQPFHEVVIGQILFDDLQRLLQGAGQGSVVRREGVVEAVGAIEVQVQHEAVFERESDQRRHVVHIQVSDRGDQVGLESHFERE